MPLVRSIYTKPQPPEPLTSTLEARRQFMVSWTRCYTRDLALEFVLRGGGQANADIPAEAFEAIEGFGKQCGASLPEIIGIVSREWVAAETNAIKFLEELRRKLWPMCRSSMPQASIIDAFNTLCIQWRISVPDDLAPKVIASIWHAAQPRRRSGWKRPPSYDPDNERDQSEGGAHAG